MITGEYIKLQENKKDLESFIKELEQNRVKNDLLNKNKYKSLYEVYYKICKKIREIEQNGKSLD